MKPLYLNSFLDKFNLYEDGNDFEWRIWQEHNEQHLGNFSLFVSYLSGIPNWRHPHSIYWERV